MDQTETRESATPAQDVKTSKPAAPVSPKPRICIKRKDDIYIPLIAVDELPTWIRLEGVPLSLRGQDVLDLGMMNCGDQAKTNNDCYHVEITDIPSDFHICHTKDQDQSMTSSPGKETLSPTGKVFVAPDKKLPDSNGQVPKVDDTQAKIAEITSNPEDSPAPIRSQGTPGTIGKKIYCTYWIRTGNCNYMQEGCKYLHEIPPDENTRLAIGVRTYPTWFREDPTLPPRSIKWQGPAAALQQSWRRQVSNQLQAELPEAPKHGHGHGRSRSPIAAPVPRSGQNKSNDLLNGSNGAPAATSTQAPALYPQTNLFPTQGQSTLFSSQQQHFPSQASSSGQQAPHSPFHSNGSTFRPATVTLEDSPSYRLPSGSLSSPKAKIPGTSERHQSAPTQPPISRPVFGMPPLNPSPAIGSSTNPPPYSPSQSAASNNTTPQANTPVNPNGNGYNRFSGFDHKRKATNSSLSHSPNSRANTPNNFNPKNVPNGNGDHSNPFNILQEGTASPPILHRRLFVPEGEPRFVANPVDEGQVKYQHKSRKAVSGKGKPHRFAHGFGKGVQSSDGHNHGVESLI